MPKPQNCVSCNKVAVVLDDNIPYCPSCYKKVQTYKKSIGRGGHLFKTKSKR